MILLRLILALLFFVMVRRIYLSYKSTRSAAEKRAGARRDQADQAEQARRGDLDDLTRQDISDADFEEIP